MKSRGVNRSIDVTRDEDNYSDDEAHELAVDKLSSGGGGQSAAHSAWEMGGIHRDHVIQNLLYLGGQLGFYRHEPVEGTSSGNKQEHEQQQEKVFYRGIYAPDEVDAIRRLLIDQDDPVERQLTVYVAHINMVPQFLVPLFYQAVDEKPFAMSLIRLFLLLTKPMARAVVDSSSHIIKKTKGKESAAESKERLGKEQKSRADAYSQISAQLAFKEALVNEDLFVVLLKFLEDPLSKRSDQRSDEDKVVIESILTLIDNLLRISAGPYSCDTEVAKAAVLHNKLILVLQGTFLDIILLLCQGVNERDNNPWRAILVEIVHFVLNRRNAKDLYKIYAEDQQAQSIAESRRGSGGESGDGNSTNQRQQQPSSHNQTHQQNKANPKVAGALTERLKCEMNARQLISRQRMTNRHSRFTGQYVVASSLGAAPAPAAVNDNDNSSSGETVQQQLPSHSGGGMIVSNPFMKVFNRPSVPRRSERRSAPFNVDDARSSGSLLSVVGGAGGGHNARLDEERRANRVVTNFLQDFLDSAFSELVFSVKEGWRRGVDESDGMTGEEELGYYMMVTTCLSFHRLKQLAEQKKTDLATRGNRDVDVLVDASIAQDERWVPDLRSVTQCFDRMSFIRPVDFMERLKKVDKKPEKIVFAMELYTELVCYLRLMVESIEPAHNDIALAALYKIFYIRQEREDPLPSLLREWAPGTYGRRHLVGLVTLAHEIMKTLDAARVRFREEATMEGLVEGGSSANDGNNNSRKKRKKGPAGASDSERSMYLVAACTFEPEDYLKRVLATNQSVKIYTSLLELYKSNTPAVNYYVQIFIQRLCLFKIEDDGFGESYAASTLSGGGGGGPSGGGVSLAHMFFNVKSLHAFNTLLQDPKAERDPNLNGLVRLIKQIILQFGALVEKNKLAFVEALFTPTFPSHHSFLQVVDSVYDAKRCVANGGRDRNDDEGGAYSYGKNKHKARLNDNSGDVSDLSDYGDEFDEEGDYATRVATKPVVDKTGGAKRRKKDNSAPATGGGGSKWTWSTEEDNMLKEKYKLYMGSHSAFDMIMNDEAFRALGGNRSKVAIGKRVRALNLHMANNSDEDDERERQLDDDDEPEMVSSGEESGASSDESSVLTAEEEESRASDGMNLSNKKRTSSSKKRKKIDGGNKKTKNSKKMKGSGARAVGVDGNSREISTPIQDSSRADQSPPQRLGNNAHSSSASADVSQKSDWLGDDDSEDERWTGHRVFKPQPVSSSSVVSTQTITVKTTTATSGSAAPSLLKKRKVSDSDDDDEDWGNDVVVDTSVAEAGVTSHVKPHTTGKRNVFSSDDSDED